MSPNRIGGGAGAMLVNDGLLEFFVYAQSSDASKGDAELAYTVFLPDSDSTLPLIATFETYDT